LLIKPTTFIDVLVAVAVDTSQLNYLVVLLVAVVVVEEVVVMLVVFMDSTSAIASAGGSDGTDSCGVKVVVGRCWQWSWL